MLLTNGKSPLDLAILAKNAVEICTLLLNHGADQILNEVLSSQLPIKQAISRRNPELVKLFINKGAHVTSEILTFANQNVTLFDGEEIRPEQKARIIELLTAKLNQRIS